MKIEDINAFLGSEKELIAFLKKTNTKVLSYIKEELNLVKKHHYQNRWMALGMLAGVFFSSVFGDLLSSVIWGSMSKGISMGMLFGLLAGRNRDIKAKQNGYQLDI